MRNQDSGILTAIVRFSLRFRGLIIALACLLTGYGLYSLSRAKYDVFPEFAPPRVVIQTEAPGLSPEQVEVLVTQRIENAVNGAPGIESLRSASIQGLSLVTVVFRTGTDFFLDRQAVAERLTALAGQLPEGIHIPVVTPLETSTSVVLVIGLTSSKRSLMEVRTIADWVVKQRILAVPGVARVAVFGKEEKQFQVQIKPDQLIKYRLGIGDVLSAARRATGVLGGGFIENENQRIVLQTEGQSLTPDQLARTVLAHHDGTSVMLGDIGSVVEAPAPAMGAATIMGRPGVELDICAQYGANGLEVTEEVEKALEELRPVLDKEAIDLHPALFRPANFIQTAIGNIRFSLLVGAGLVVIVLFLFLFNLRTAAISLTAIPLSLLMAIILLDLLGFSLNTLTLGGLAIAIGQVVDDAVIDVENILRRLRENRRLEVPRPMARVVLDASIEVRHPVVYATFGVALVFIPVLTMSGVAGRLFAPLGIAFIIATLFSLLVALTLTSALCLVLLGRKLPEKESPIVTWLKEKYRSILREIERYPRTVILGVGLLVVGGLAVLPYLESKFLPELREGHFIVHMLAIPGTSLQESERLGQEVSRDLLKIPYVRSVSQRAGRAEKSEDVVGTHYSEFEVDLKPLRGKESEFAESEIRKVLAKFPGVNMAVKTFLVERIEETLAGYAYSVVINIFGNDLGVLDKKAQEVAHILRRTRGATEVLVQSPPGTPQLIIRLRKNDLMRWGIAPVDALDAIHTAYQGNVAGQVYDGNRVFDVSVILDLQSRKSITDVGKLPLRNSAGTYVTLRQLADIFETSGRYVVLHEGARRVQTVTCNVAGRDVNSFVGEARRQILSTISFPSGGYIEFTGTAAAQAKSRRDLLIYSLLAGIGLILLLSIVMSHYRNLLLIMTNLPFALVGGVLSVFVFGIDLSLGSLVGFVTIFGITLRNSMLMLSHYEHLVSVEGAAWGLETAIRGASERLAPILMTALVTALGMLPLAIVSGAPGCEIEGPMAIVILGGLVTSTALNLLVLPTLALRYGRFEKKEQDIF